MKKVHKDNLFWGAVGLVSVATVVIASFKIAPSISNVFGEAASKVEDGMMGGPQIIGTAVSAMKDYGGIDALEHSVSGLVEDAEQYYNSSKAEMTASEEPTVAPSATSGSSPDADADTTQAVYYVSTTDTEYDAKGTVVRVKDGDTYVLDIDGVETTIRLIGVDTPESVAPEEYSKENTQEGIDVSNIVKDTIKAGDTLLVEYDVGRTDTYGRTLAYLYFESGVMVQEWLLSNGYAQVMTVQPNVKYADHFVTMERVAMNSKLGLWNGFFTKEE